MTGPVSVVTSEVFGPTIQGEGPNSGRRAAFVRFGLCNLSCGAGEGATWKCDTPYTWDWRGQIGPKQNRAALVQRESDDIAAEVLGMDVPLVVVTGGEPFLQQAALTDLALRLHGAGAAVEVETNGTLAPRANLAQALRDGVLRLNVSPKLSNSGEFAVDLDVIRILLATGAVQCVKWVVANAHDLDEVASVCALVPLDPALVWVMPAGTDRYSVEARAEWLAPLAIERGWNMTQRLHVLVWGNERGH